MKQDFPIFSREINGRPLVYLDNAATTQKPAVVIDAMSNIIHPQMPTYTELFIPLREKQQKVMKSADDY